MKLRGVDKQSPSGDLSPAAVGMAGLLGSLASGNPDEWQEGYAKMSEAELVAVHKVFGALKDLSPRQQAETIEKVKAQFGMDFGNPKREVELQRVVLEHARDFMAEHADALPAVSFRLDAGEQRTGLGFSVLGNLAMSEKRGRTEALKPRLRAWFAGKDKAELERLVSYLASDVDTGIDKLREDPSFRALVKEADDIFSEKEIEAYLRGKTDEAGVEPELTSRAFTTAADELLISSDVTIEQMIERASLLTLAPGCTSAANSEALLMANAFLLHPLTRQAGDNDAQRLHLVYRVMGAVSHCAELGVRNDGHVYVGLEPFRLAMLRFRGIKGRDSLITFGYYWHRSSFARLEVGHKLAASLCLTDIPDDIEVKAPWEAWSFVIPDGLLVSQQTGFSLRRAWCVGTRVVQLVDSRGEISMFELSGLEQAALEDEPLGSVLRSLIRGACLALSNPDDFRKEKQHAPTARSSKKQRGGPPDLQQARFMLSAPVQVNLREHVAAALTGKAHASPTVQFLVRGHWRNQVHGPRNSLRRAKWIQPFWKGPPESRILLRQHRVEDPHA